MSSTVEKERTPTVITRIKLQPFSDCMRLGRNKKDTEPLPSAVKTFLEQKNITAIKTTLDFHSRFFIQNKVPPLKKIHLTPTA